MKKFLAVVLSIQLLVTPTYVHAEQLEMGSEETTENLFDRESITESYQSEAQAVETESQESELFETKSEETDKILEESAESKETVLETAQDNGMDEGGNPDIMQLNNNIEPISLKLFESREIRCQVPSLGFVGWRSKNNSIVTCSAAQTDYEIVNGKLIYYSINTIKGMAAGDATVEVYNLDTDEVYATYNVSVASYSYSNCVGQPIEVEFESRVQQGYTASDDASALDSCKLISTSSFTINGISTYAYKYQVIFKKSGDFQVTFTGKNNSEYINIPVNITKHIWKNEYTIDSEPTCTLEGSKSKHCGICDVIDDSTVSSIDKLPHSPGEWEIIREATTEIEGVRKKLCLVCNTELESEIIPKLNMYTVTLDANGGQFLGDSSYVSEWNLKKIEKKPLILDIKPEKSAAIRYMTDDSEHSGAYNSLRDIKYKDFTFQGWNTRPDGNGVTYALTDSYSVDASITLYAQWEKVYFDNLEVGCMSDGYRTDGWSDKKTGGKILTSTTEIESDLDVYLQLTKADVQINKPIVELDIGESETLSLVVLPEGCIKPDDKINWFEGLTPDDCILEVGDGGKITAIREGVTDVWASFRNDIIGTNSVDCKVKVKGFIYRLYDTLLNREPDEGGLKVWSDNLYKYGRPGAGIAEGFVMSSEIDNQNLTNGEFVERMYKTFLNRSSDPGGKQNWVKLMDNGVSRRYVFHGFAESNEFQEICDTYGVVRGDVPLMDNRDKNADVTMFVNRLYNVCLGRPAEEGGLNNWTGQINNHETSPKDVAKGFIFSKELQEKNLSNEDYVELHYNAFMGRGADAPGKANWVNQLENGKISREDLFWGFANSNEFEEIIASYGL